MKTKLTIVSLWCKGKRFAHMAHLPLDAKGNPYIGDNDLQKMCDEIGIPVGCTIAIGI